MFKYTPRKDIVNQLLKFSYCSMVHPDEYEYIKTMFNKNVEILPFLRYYVAFNAYYSKTKLTHIQIKSARFPVEFFDTEEVS